MNLKELRIRTLSDDIRTCGMNGMSKYSIQRLLRNRYVNRESDITNEEFSKILYTEYAKVEKRRQGQWEEK